jgi:hypothetical protein
VKVLIILLGFELQVSVKVPKPIVSPQRYFPVYSLAPYRLLCVIAGLFIAFVFTMFPAQISEHKILRKNVVSSLSLLATYSSSVSATLDQRIRGLEGDTTDASSPGRILKDKRNSILFKELALLSGMRQISTMVPWEVSLGGKFPKNSYDKLVDETQRLVLCYMSNYPPPLTSTSAVASLSVIGYISQTFPQFGQLPSNDFIRRAYSASLLHPDSSVIATTLSLLALSLSASSQLTPGLQAPSSSHRLHLLKRGIDELGGVVLSDPNFEALLVVEVASTRLISSLEVMINTVGELVGTTNFGEDSRVAANDHRSMSEV